jgi:hypothetical protein
MRRLWIVLPLLFAACSSTPTAPTPVVPACQQQNTAELTLRNASPNNLTFDVLIDNVLRGTMAVGQTVGPVTLTAGVQHTVVSRVTNTSTIACTSSPSFAQCSTNTLTCSF